MRAYFAEEAGDRKVEAFALFNVFYQTGILVGPLVGLVFLGVSFRSVCMVAALLFLALLALQARALPSRSGDCGPPGQTMLADWRQAVANRPFLLFSLAMIGSYVLNFQVYLGLPIEVRRATGGEMGVAIMFAVSGLLTILGQVRVTAWVKARWAPLRAITYGLLLLASAFVPLALASTVANAPPAGQTGGVHPWWLYAARLSPVIAGALLLSLATMIIYPFEMATIVSLAGSRAVGTYYGLYNALSGIGIAAGTLLTGAALDVGRGVGIPALPWVVLTATGCGCAVAVWRLDRGGRLDSGSQPAGPTMSAPAVQGGFRR